MNSKDSTIQLKYHQMVILFTHKTSVTLTTGPYRIGYEYFYNVLTIDARTMYT